MHGLDCCWSELLRSDPCFSSSEERLHKQPKFKKHKSPVAEPHSSNCWRTSVGDASVLPQAALAAMPWISLCWAPEVLTHTQQVTQHRNLPPGACFMKPTQSKLLLFAPAATKLLFRSPSSFVLPHPAWSCLCFPHPCQLWFFLPLTQGIRLCNVSRPCSPEQLCCQCRQGVS